MKSYIFEHGQKQSNIRWGMGTVLKDAEGSTGQTSSSDKWSTIKQLILKGKTTK